METGRMEDDQQFCLRWNNHQSTLVSVFDTLLEKGMHVDCTLAAEGQTLKAHKVVLSACSPYFESVLSQQYDKHPIIILKDVKYAELRAMMDYMYRGEVNISQEQLGALLKAAESLQIKGLSDNKPPRPAAASSANAHPPRSNDTHSQKRDSSADSRSGSSSPTRRRKKVRRLSSPPPHPAPAVTPTPLAATPLLPPNPVPITKQEEGAGVEDLTLDEEPPVPPTDVVRNFQWHMERSQEDLLNSNDTRDSQDGRPRHSIVTRSKKSSETSASLLTVLKPAQISSALPILSPAPVIKPPSPSPDVKTCPSPVVKTSPVSTPEEQKRTPAEKQYECVTCGRRYNARRNLMRHMKLECGRDPRYKCPHCTYTKHRRNELKRHIEKKHTPAPCAPATPVSVTPVSVT